MCQRATRSAGPRVSPIRTLPPTPASDRPAFFHSVSWCHLLPQVSNTHTHTPSHPCDLTLTLRLLCVYTAPYVASCNAPCVLTPFCHNQHEPFSAICATVALLWDWASIRSPHTSICLWLVTGCPSLDNFWQALTVVDPTGTPNKTCCF